MPEPHRDERKSSPHTSCSSSDTPSDTDSDSSTDPPRKPYAQRLREEVDRRVRKKALEDKEIDEMEARDRAKRQRWRHGAVRGPKPQLNGNANPSPPNDLEKSERHATGRKVIPKTSTRGTSTGSAKGSSWSSIAPRLSAELALKTALAEFIETVDMYYSIDQEYDSTYP